MVDPIPQRFQQAPSAPLLESRPVFQSVPKFQSTPTAPTSGGPGPSTGGGPGAPAPEEPTIEVLRTGQVQVGGVKFTGEAVVPLTGGRTARQIQTEGLREAQKRFGPIGPGQFTASIPIELQERQRQPVAPPQAPIPRLESRVQPLLESRPTLGRRISSFLGEGGKRFVGFGIVTGGPGGFLTAAELNIQLREAGGLPGRTAALLIPETPGEVALFGAVGGLAGGLAGPTIARGTGVALVGLNVPTVFDPRAPAEERIASGLIATGGAFGAAGRGFVRGRARTEVTRVKKGTGRRTPFEDPFISESRIGLEAFRRSQQIGKPGTPFTFEFQKPLVQRFDIIRTAKPTRKPTIRETPIIFDFQKPLVQRFDIIQTTKPRPKPKKPAQPLTFDFQKPLVQRFDIIEPAKPTDVFFTFERARPTKKVKPLKKPKRVKRIRTIEDFSTPFDRGAVGVGPQGSQQLLLQRPKQIVRTKQVLQQRQFQIQRPALGERIFTKQVFAQRQRISPLVTQFERQAFAQPQLQRQFFQQADAQRQFFQQAQAFGTPQAFFQPLAQPQVQRFRQPTALAQGLDLGLADPFRTIREPRKFVRKPKDKKPKKKPRRIRVEPSLTGVFQFQFGGITGDLPTGRGPLGVLPGQVRAVPRKRRTKKKK